MQGAPRFSCSSDVLVLLLQCVVPPVALPQQQHVPNRYGRHLGTWHDITHLYVQGKHKHGISDDIMHSTQGQIVHIN